MATLGLLKINVLWNKGYDVILSVHDVTSKTLSRVSNYIVDLVMWPKIVNSCISMRENIITSTLNGFNQKYHFFLRGGIGSGSIIWDWHKEWTWNFTPVW